MNERTAVPLYQQIKEDIKAAIQQGTYKAKEKIPTEPELSAQYSISRITVRRAIEELCGEGYLIKRQGLGTFVSTPRIHRKITDGNRLESFSTLCQSYGMEAGAHLLSRQIVPIRQEEQEFFGLEADALLIYVERLRTADNLPIFLENMFFPYPTFRGLMTEDLNNRSIFQVMKQINGRTVKDTSRCTLEIAKASPEQAQKLGIPTGDPLLFMNCYFIDQNSHPLCIGRQYYVGSRYMFEL